MGVGARREFRFTLHFILYKDFSSLPSRNSFSCRVWVK